MSKALVFWTYQAQKHYHSKDPEYQQQERNQENSITWHLGTYIRGNYESYDQSKHSPSQRYNVACEILQGLIAVN